MLPFNPLCVNNYRNSHVTFHLNLYYFSRVESSKKSTVFLCVHLLRKRDISVSFKPVSDLVMCPTDIMLRSSRISLIILLHYHIKMYKNWFSKLLILNFAHYQKMLYFPSLNLCIYIINASKM